MTNQLLAELAMAKREIERLNKELESKNKVIDAMIDNEEEYCIEINNLKDRIDKLEEENKKLKYVPKIDHYPELIDLRTRIFKAIEYNKQIIEDVKEFYRPTKDIIYSGDTIIAHSKQNIEILKGDDKE